MKSSFCGWLILIAGSGIFFVSTMFSLAWRLSASQPVWWIWMHNVFDFGSQAARHAAESLQPVWKVVLLFLSVVTSFK